GEISPDCDFATFADLTLAAARRRYGEPSPEATAVAEGWAGVGVAGDGQAPPGQAPPEQQPDTPAPAVVVRRSGGVAGITKRVTVRLDLLPAAERETWLLLLDSERLTAWSAT